MTASELQKETGKNLTQLGVSKSEVDRFMSNPGDTPTTRAAISDSMGEMRSVAGIQNYVRLIQVVQSREVAHFYQQRIRLAEDFHRSVRPLEKMVVVGVTPVFVDRQGNTIVTAPVDYLYWNADLADRINNLKTKIGNKPCDLYITGQASEVARKNLEAVGVKLHENTKVN